MEHDTVKIKERKTAVVEFFSGPADTSEPLLEGLFRGDDLAVDLLRARVTTTDAWFRLAITGTTAAIERFVRRHRNRFLVLTTPATSQVA